ncbi:MAG: MBL fold metallo-hydrolase [Ardenticatenaceae bacterium]
MITTPHLLFLGTSGSQGVPQLGCDCAVCRSATPGTPNFRTRASLLLVGAEGRILIDTPHETRLRFTELKLPLPKALFMTHPHDDHILGFADFVKALRDMSHSCPIFAPKEVFTGLRERFAYLWLGKSYQKAMDLRPLTGSVSVAGWSLEAVRVNHGFNGWSYGYFIERAGWRVGYFSDAINVHPSVQRHWRGLDLLILGANFWHEDAPMQTRSVYDVQEALAVAKEAGVRKLILTHLSHKINAKNVHHRLPDWASLAWDGRIVRP